MLRKSTLITLLLLALCASFASVTTAQETILCGYTGEAEFTEDEQEIAYTISGKPGDVIEVSAEAFGSSLYIGSYMLGPNELGIARSGEQKTPTLSYETGQLSASGDYTIVVTNKDYVHVKFVDKAGTLNYFNGAGIGLFTLNVGCTLRDGTVIEPGQAVAAEPTEAPSLPAGPSFTGVGFPGLPPVDFTSAFRLPLTLGAPTEGEIPVSGSAVLGLYFSASAGDTLDLNFERLSGNLNLGLVVLSAENQVAYMAALVSSQTMTSRLTLPTAGEYTVGIFRLDLIPPAAAEATRFRVSAQLNP